MIPIYVSNYIRNLNIKGKRTAAASAPYSVDIAMGKKYNMHSKNNVNYLYIDTNCISI